MRTYLAVIAATAVLCAACKDEGDESGSKEEVTEEATSAIDPDETTEPEPDPAAEKLERGAYLVETVMNCAVCHTPMGDRGPDMSRRYAGGFEVDDVMGTWRSPNITQDEETGIGSWTDEQIVAAIRQGVRPDGSRMFPIMPYPFYRALSDEDAEAVVAYLRTIEPIENEVEPIEELKMAKVEMPPPDGEAPETDDELAYGGYLAKLMKCAHCHSPITKKGEFDMDRLYAGGLPMEAPFLGEGKLYAPNITPHEKTGIGGWSAEEIRTAMTTMKRPDDEPILGPMVFFGMNWAKMKDEDLDAVVAFLQDLDPIEHEVPESTFEPHGPPPGAGAPAGGKGKPSKSGKGKPGKSGKPSGGGGR